MAPRNFNEDGASGAGGMPTTSTGTGGVTVADPMRPSAMSAGSFGNNNVRGMSSPMLAPASSGENQGHRPSQRYGSSGLPMMFDDGGSMPDDDGTGNGDLVSLALATVDSALQYGRGKYGLGGDQQQAAMMPTIPGSQSESGIPPDRPKPRQAQGDGSFQVAGRMPGVPGNQSESGRPPIQPMPGPLPPTSNPFGKRADAGDGDGDADDIPGGGGQSGAIPDDEAQETA